MSFIEQCKKIISINSTPSAGNEEVALYCGDLCKAMGLEVTYQKVKVDGKPQLNLFARPPKSNWKESGEIIFQTHLDTVESGPMGHWTKTDNNPFQATIVDDHIYGLGTADVKLDFICKLHALSSQVRPNMRKPFVLVGTYLEELGMLGAQEIIKQKMVNAKQAIIGEPSELQVVYANNGYVVGEYIIPFSKQELEIRKKLKGTDSSTTQEKMFHGKAAHSSTPHLGESAILKMIDYLTKLPEGIVLLEAHGGAAINTVPADAHVEIDASGHVEGGVVGKIINVVKELRKLEREFVGYENAAFSPPHPTLNIGLVKTDDKGLVMGVSFRITPNIDKTELDQWMARLKVSAEVEGAEFRVTRLSPSALTSPTSELVLGCVEISRSVGLPERPITKASGTEASIYSSHGIECVVFGSGVSIGNSHTANEYNILSQLEKSKEFYKEAVKRFCL